MRILTSSTLLVSNSAVSYAMVMPVSPAAAAIGPENATVHRQRQTAAAMPAAMIFVICLCAIMYVLRYDRYSPL